MENADLDLNGIREGDHHALAIAAQRRGPSVVAYCNQVCGPDKGEIAAAEAFARMRSVVCAHDGEAPLDGEQVLRRATRHAAAGIAREPQGPPPTGAIRGRHTTSCLDVAILLAAAAGGGVDPEQRVLLRSHIEVCERCSALAEITRRADTAYTDPPNDRIGSRLADRLAAVMAGVSSGPMPAAPPPTAPTVVEPLLPQLPGLEDEIAIGEQPAPVPAAPALPVVSEPTGGRRWSRLLRPRRTLAPVALEPAPAPAPEPQSETLGPAEQIAA